MNQKEREERSALFAAANSGRGFLSLYDRVFDRPEIKHRYIVKGGPGTGKSSFMRSVAVAAENKGRSVRYYRCSSDPDSLDAIVIDGGLVVLDGTAPHTVEPRLSGARDEIVNLGAFWDGARLRERYDEIEREDKEKSTHYRRAYRYLSAAMELEEIADSLIRPYLREEKMRRAAKRLLRDLPEGEGFDLLPGLQCAIGMKGRVCLESYRVRARRILSVEEVFGCGWRFLLCVLDECRQKRQPVWVSYDPLLPDHPDGVLLPSLGLCFVIKRGEDVTEDGRIRMRRFMESEIPASVKSEYRVSRRMSEALVKGAEDALGEAGKAHARLERIYGECMDFSSLDAFTKSFCDQVIGT